MREVGKDWALVLAGGDGTRLAEVAEDDGSGPVPKQYCHYLGERTLLERTIDRAHGLVDRGGSSRSSAPTTNAGGTSTPTAARRGSGWYRTRSAAPPRACSSP